MRLWFVFCALLFSICGRVFADPFEDDEGAAAVRPDPAAGDAVQFTDQNFDQWLFDGNGGASAAHARLGTLLRQRIDALAEAYGYTDEQKRKLELAGRGDIRRYFERVDELRKRFQAVKTDRNGINEILQAIQPLRIEAGYGLFGKGSFFDKTMKTVLTGEQMEHYRRDEGERSEFRYRSVVERYVWSLDESLGLRDEQRTGLVALILETSKPPLRFGPYDLQVVIAQVGRVPEERLKPLFDDYQWRIFQRQHQMARNIEPFLRQQGILPERDAEALK